MTHSPRQLTGAAVLAAALLLVAACDESPTRPSEIQGQTWRLVSLQRAGAAPIAVADPSRYTIRFADAGHVNVRSDCNTCGGGYSLTGASMSIGALACTRAFCGEASLDFEYTRALQTARSLGKSGDQLTIQCDGVVLRFGM
ncbi:MAG TPA: META domain-containing protein [Vicinamibacterales bacterium]|nr:META domain-containing protein [Vicinamibacterales bacterium]